MAYTTYIIIVQNLAILTVYIKLSRYLLFFISLY